MLLLRVYCLGKERNTVPVHRWDGGSWFAEVTDTSRAVYKVLERVYNQNLNTVFEIISPLPEDWAQTPVWKDVSPLVSCQLLEAKSPDELPEALQQQASQLWKKHISVLPSASEQDLSLPQQQPLQPSALKRKQPQQQEPPRASSSRPRPEIQVGLLSPPELSLEHQCSRPQQTSSSSSNGAPRKKFRSKRYQKTRPKAIDVATSS